MAPNSDSSHPEFSFRTRDQYWSQLKKGEDAPLNVLIVGGGVVGAGLLRELSLRGVDRCTLIEKNDFASGASGASSKLIHAGLRYLEQSWERLKKRDVIGAWRNFLYVFQASNERRVLGELAPHLIKPKPIYFVVAESDRRSLFGVFIGVWLYYLIQLLQGQFFSPPKTVFRKDAIKWIAPELNYEQVRAVFSFWDSETDDARLVIENLQTAVESGGMALNYIEALKYKRKDHLVYVTLKNQISGETVEVVTKVFINAAGPFLDDVRRREASENSAAPKQAPLLDRVAGAHIDVFPALAQESYYVTAGDGRLVFVLKRNEDGLIYSRIGTTERPLKEEDSSDHPQATKWEVDYLKNLAETYFSKARITDETIINVDAGIRPLMNQASLPPFQKSREHRIVYDGPIIHIVSVKLTDFRKVAREVANGVPWSQFGIGLSKNTHHVDMMLLRSRPVKNLYLEDSVEDIVNFTMVIKEEDYIVRRRGLRMKLLSVKDPEKLQWELAKLKNLLK